MNRSLANEAEFRLTVSGVRAVDDDLEDDDEEKEDRSAFTIEGLAAGYGVLSNDLGGFREKIAPGAFTRALAGAHDVKCLFQHDPNFILGRCRGAMADTLTLIDSREGLRFRCQLDRNNSDHRNIYASVKRGDISSCSFAFKPVDGDGEDWEATGDERGHPIALRTLKNVNLFDVSVVTDPAYPATSAAARQAALHGVSYRMATSLSPKASLRHSCVMATIAREGRKILLERQSAADFRVKTKLALGKIAQQMGCEIWTPEGYDSRGLPTGLRPMTTAEFDIEVRRRCDQIDMELRPIDACGRVYGLDPEWGQSPHDPEIGI